MYRDNGDAFIPKEKITTLELDYTCITDFGVIGFTLDVQHMQTPCPFKVCPFKILKVFHVHESGSNIILQPYGVHRHKKKYASLISL